MSFNFREKRKKKKKDQFIFSFSSSSTPSSIDREDFLWPLWAQAHRGAPGEQAWRQQRYRKSWIIWWEFPLFICNFKLYRLLNPLLSPQVTLPSRVDFFSTRIHRMTPEVPMILQATPPRQVRTKHGPRSSCRDQEVMHSSVSSVQLHRWAYLTAG